MKIYQIKLILSLFYLFSAGLLWGQDKNYTLITNESGATKNYVARDYIKMEPGFSYSASDSHSFKAKIDEKLLFPPTENTYAMPDGTITNSTQGGGIVGAIPGQFAVSSSGAATYSVPIDCPPGINGVQPNLSLVYNSQGGSGIAGWGWEMGGLSSISRAGSTLYHDNKLAAIQLTTADNLMLDGQRLILFSGSNLTEGAKYRTEIESYCDIEIVIVNGLLCFEVRTKDGTTMEFGSTVNSCIEAQGKTVPLCWLLTKITDTNGNYMTYSYTENNASGDFRLDKINYTGNSNVGISASNEISFHYQERYDIQRLYFAGSKVAHSGLLKYIRVKTDSKILKEYELLYVSEDGETSSEDNVNTRLSKIKLNTADANTIYNSTRIVWGEESFSYQNKDLVVPGLYNSTPQKFYYADFNGDGRTDFLAHTVNGVTIDLYLAENSTNGFTKTAQYTSPGPVKNILTGDFDGDGYCDFVYMLGQYSPYSYGLVTYNGFGFANDIFNITSTSGEAVTGDYNGDGKCELLMKEDSKLYGLYSHTLLLLGSGGITWGPNLIDCFPRNEFLIDFNGNGKTDVFVTDVSGYRIYEFQGSGFSLISNGRYPDYRTNVNVGDFNGDGKTDLFTQEIVNEGGSDVNKTSIHFSTGIGFEEKSLPYLRDHFSNFYIGDFDGDGKSDLTCLVYPSVDNNRTTYYDQNIPSPDLSVKMRYQRLLSMGDDFFLANDFESGYNYITADYLKYMYNSDFDGDGKDDWLLNFHMMELGVHMTLTSFNNNEDLFVKKIINGMGIQTCINYAYSCNSDVYTNNACTVDPEVYAHNIDNPNYYMYPVSFLNNKIKLVSRYYNGVDNNLHEVQMKYSNAAIHRQGKGFLGFGTIVEHDLAKDLWVKNSYSFDKDYFNPYQIKKEMLTSSDFLISMASFVNNKILLGGKRIFPYVSMQTSTDLLTGLSVKTECQNFDSWGNLLKIKTTKGGLSETKTMSYVQKGGWCPGRIDTLIMINTSGNETYKRTNNYLYDNYGNLIKEVSDPGDENSVTTEYKNFDGFGHPRQVSVTANNMTRTSSVTYTPSGRFIHSKTNVTGDLITYDWDETNSLLKSETSRLGTVFYTYNKFGQLTETKYPDGIRKSEVFQWASPGNALGAKYFAYSKTSGSAPVYVWYDALGRDISKETYGRNGRKISLFTTYYADGKVEKISEPTFDTSPAVWAEKYTYDPYGRPKTVETPRGMTTTDYNLVQTTVTSPEETIVRVLNNSGQIYQSKQNGKTVTYTYYASGLPKTTTPEGGQALTLEYDLQGNRTKLTDPDGGIVESKYNGFGEQLSSKQEIKVGEYITTTNAYEPTTGLLQNIVRNGETTVYSYDTNHRLTSIEIVGKHKRTFEYDDFDRVVQANEYIDNKVFATKTEYDAFGREKKQLYPSEYYLTNTYDSIGILTEVKDKAGRSIWKPLEENANGQLTSINRGGKTTTFEYDSYHLPSSIKSPNVINLSYNFNLKGNLQYRIDSLTNQKEQFLYDIHNRLTNWDVYQNSVLAKQNSIIYDPTTSNITRKSDLDNLTMNYGENGRPHALTSISGKPTAIPFDSLNVTYTDFKKISTLEEGSKYYTLAYGVDDQRSTSVYSVNGVLKQTRYYLGDYEEEVNSVGNVRKIHYLSGGAVYIQNYNKDTLLYCYSDYQGSLIALTDEGGNVVERYAYDPWGQRRNPTNWTQTDTRTTWRLNRGYTGHEHLDAFGIINMNGRVYDPLTSMFFSPDPYVQAPDSWLNYNRYGYCYGNPFKYTDPDGECPWLVFALYGAWQMGIQAGSAAENNGGQFWGGFWKGAVVGFATGALSSIAPFGTQYVGSMAWGAIVGTASQAGNVWAMGGNNYQDIWKGALIGGVMGFISSEQFVNLAKGKDFASNDQILKNYAAGKYDITGFDTWQNAALDYFGFEGKYDPSNDLFDEKYGAPSNAVTDPLTGEKFYNDGAFALGHDGLAYYADHEWVHSIDVKSGKYSNPNNDYVLTAKEEFKAYSHNYRNQGLYPKHGRDIPSEITYHGKLSGKYYDLHTNKIKFNEPWLLKYIYKIPRRF